MKFFITTAIMLTIIIGSNSSICGERKAPPAKVAAVATIAAITNGKPKVKAKPKVQAKKAPLAPRTSARMIAQPELEENNNHTIRHPTTGTRSAQRQMPVLHSSNHR